MSSLASKLETDALLKQCTTHVQELHALFVTWFQGKADKAELETDLRQRLAINFSHVAPNGQFIRGANVLIGHLQDKYSVYKERVFDIQIFNVRILWTDGQRCLCTYEEWQSWKQAGEDIQFGRLSTALLQTTSAGMQWIHVHETWLEAEAPPTTANGGASVGGAPVKDADESVETGPKQEIEKESAAPEEEVAFKAAPTVAAPVVAAPAATPSSSSNNSSNYRLLYFMSSSTLNQQQLMHQNLANSRLKALGLDYETVDAGDVATKDFRNQLFNLSGQRAVYPLFFLRNYDSVVYWGNWEQFLKAVYAKTLMASIESGKPAPALPMEDSDDDDSESDEEGPAPAPKAPVIPTTRSTSVLKRLSPNPTPQEAAPPAPAPAPAAPVSAMKRLSPAPVVKEESAPAPAPAAAPAPARVVKEAPKPAPVKPALAKPTPMPPITHTPGESAVLSQSYVNRMSGNSKTLGREVSSKRHVSPQLNNFAKPLTWESTLVGISVAGFDIGTSQGPIADEAWYKKQGAVLEDMAQSRSIPRPRRKICLPEMVFPSAHVAMEGHGVWFSWDSSDALESWARAHHEIAIHSRISHNGVSVMRARDAKLWDVKRKHGAKDDKVSSVFHYDWTYSTPFTGKHDGGKWKELSESGMNVALLTDTSVPILFFDEIILFEDDLHDNGQVQYSVKLRVMPTCSYVLARLWVRVDNIILRVRETRILFAFGDGSQKPEIFRDVSWRECMWNSLADHKLPTDLKAWHHEGPETPAWSGLLKSLPEVALPRGMPKYAAYEYSGSEAAGK